MNDDRNGELIARIEDLETRVAFQEEAIESLSTTLYQQQQVNDRLVLRLERLAAQAQDLAERMSAPGQGGHEPPPHY